MAVGADEGSAGIEAYCRGPGGLRVKNGGAALEPACRCRQPWSACCELRSRAIHVTPDRGGYAISSLCCAAAGCGLQLHGWDILVKMTGGVTAIGLLLGCAGCCMFTSILTRPGNACDTCEYLRMPREASMPEAPASLIPWARACEKILIPMHSQTQLKTPPSNGVHESMRTDEPHLRSR